MKALLKAHSVLSTMIVAWIGVYAVLFLGESGLESVGVRSGGWGEGHWQVLAEIATVVWAVVLGIYLLVRRRHRADPR